MGQGKRWSSEESAHLAEAWIHASEGVGEFKVKGTSQDGNEFWGKVLEEFGRKAPANAAPGTYLKRENKGGETRPPIENHFREKIQRDCKKFNTSLRKVLCSNPTGCSEQEKINMAVAIHLGKSDSMSYRHKGFEPNDWPFYQAWLVLKSHRAFLPPTPQPPDEDIEEIEDYEDSVPPSDTAQALFTTPKVATASDTSGDSDVQLSMQPSKQRSRGPGYGVKKTKALKKQEEYRAKKHKTQQEFLEIQRQRSDSFRVYVNNKSRHDAFKMAVMGYNAFKDHDPEQAEYYKRQMERILGNAVPDDTVNGTDDASGDISD
ncbi:hypothetical protein IV203_012936 [Nitzschia inconspicua]|uniref:No apical meristem-associated C-terminal domain-containing protein n=1 Tax=Nitzschia inconspicua TaxID=303405 RepID=A0A9K3Q7M3_9STRA|nr:hypothetical protein IV203_012936 [Nitzschia inconspicua]